MGARMQGNWQNPNNPQQQPQQGYAPAPNPVGGPAQPYRAPAPAGGANDASFFSALFDFSFKSFITLKFLKVIYILLAVLVCLLALFGMYGAVESNTYVMLPAIPVGAVLYLVAIRMGMETFVLLFRFLQRKAEGP